MNDVNRAGPASQDADQALAAALIDVLARSPTALTRLRDLVRVTPPAPDTPFWTVTALANAAGVSARVVRGAIARGELKAVKRGRRWIISPDSVRDWADFEPAAEPGRARRRRGRVRRPLRDTLALLDEGANISRRRL